MANPTRYHNPEHVIFQTLNRETIIINLMTGRYYSLNPTASEIWEHLVHQASADEIADTLAAITIGDRDAIGKVVDTFVGQLVREELVVVVADPDATRRRESTSAVLTSQESFTLPELTLFTDMERLMPLDPPIHQYSKGDWNKATKQ